MTRKRYAPDAPDVRLHRPGDTVYLRELLEAAGLSQRKAGPLLGMDERSMRSRASGDRDLTYPEQYCLEVLADRAQGDTMNAVVESTPAPIDASNAAVLLVALLDGLDNPIPSLQVTGDEIYAVGKKIAEQAKRTAWHRVVDRPLTAADAGKIIVGRDRFGAPIHGTLIRDGFGLVIREAHPQPADVHNVPIDRVDQYALLDPPPSA